MLGIAPARDDLVRIDRSEPGAWQWQPGRSRWTCSRRCADLLVTGDGVQEGTDLSVLLHGVAPIDQDRVSAALEALVTQGLPMALTHGIVLPDGSQRTVHHHAMRTEPEEGTGGHVVGIVRECDVEWTRQRLHDLHAYEDGLIEEERKRIAREIHDEFGQSLTALRMDLSLMRMRFGHVAGMHKAVDAMCLSVDRILNVARHVARNLRPPTLDFGFHAAIEWLAEDFGHRWELPCEVVLDGEEVVLGGDVQTALFRIVQESLTNVARHARARRVAIRLRYTGPSLALVVEDDGRGFDTRIMDQRIEGFGLLGMRERARKIGATLHIASTPASGTAVSVTLQLA